MPASGDVGAGRVVARSDPPPPARTDGALRAQLLDCVLRYCPPFLRDDADDIAQKGWLRLRAYTESGAPIDTPLIARAAYCATIDAIRQRRRRREVPLVEAPGERAGDDPVRALGGRELREAIADCLRRMLADRRSAVTLRLLGHTVPDCARILDWPGKRVENMVLRGLADLRRCLSSKGITP